MQMYNRPGGEEAHATAPEQTSSSMPAEHSYPQQQGLVSKDKLERGERERPAIRKERSSPASPFRRSPNDLLLLATSQVPSAKRRCMDSGSQPGSHAENGKLQHYSGTISPAESWKRGRDVLDVHGSGILASPGCSESFGSGSHCKDQEEVSGGRGGEPLLFSPDGRNVACLVEQASRAAGSVTPESRPFLELDKVKPGSSNTGCDHLQRESKDRTHSKPELHRRTGSFLKLDSGRDWCLVDKEFAARQDRYGSAMSRDHTFKVVSCGRKELSSPHQAARDKPSAAASSSLRSTAVPSGNGYLKPGSLYYSGSLDLFAGASASAQHFPVSMGMDSEVAHDGGELTSPCKRPRLGWGQGLAKYEKEKVGVAPEDSSASKNKESSPLAVVEDTAVAGSSPTEPEDNVNAVASKESASIKVQESNIVVPETTSHEDIVIEASDVQVNCPADNKLLAHASCSGAQSESGHLSCFPESQAVNVSAFNSTEITENMSKESIMQSIEKIEYEIELAEKELANLESSNSGEGVPTIEDIGNQTEIKMQEEVAIPMLHTSESTVLNVAEGASSSSLYPKVKSPDVPVCEADDSNNIQENACDTAIHSMIHLPSDGLENRVSDGSELMPPKVEIHVFVMELQKRNALECARLIMDNQRLAKQSFESLAHLLPHDFFTKEDAYTYTCPERAPVWSQNMENHKRVMKLLEGKIIKEKQLLRFKQHVLTLKYRVMRDLWKLEEAGRDPLIQQQMNVPLSMETDQCIGFASVFQNAPAKLPLIVADKAYAVKQQLLNEQLVDQHRVYLKMPAMILDEKERNSRRFITNHFLVENPVAVESERKATNPWSAEERRLFLEKFSALGKNFSRIATFLQHKTVADCVEFYYRNHKSEEFDKVRRRQQLRKRRDNSRISASSYLATTTSAAASRHREANNMQVEGLNLVAEVAAAVASSTSSALKDMVRAGRTTGGKGHAHHLVSIESERQSVKKHVSVKEKNPSNSSVLDSKGSVSHEKDLTWPPPNSNTATTPKNGNVELSGSFKAASKGNLNECTDSYWSDSERELFTDAVAMYGKDFHSISLYVGSKSEGQCKAFFTKARKRLGLDRLVEKHYQATLQDRLEEDDSKQMELWGGFKTEAPPTNTLEVFSDVVANAEEDCMQVKAEKLNDAEVHGNSETSTPGGNFDSRTSEDQNHQQGSSIPSSVDNKLVSLSWLPPTEPEQASLTQDVVVVESTGCVNSLLNPSNTSVCKEEATLPPELDKLTNEFKEPSQARQYEGTLSTLSGAFSHAAASEVVPVFHNDAKIESSSPSPVTRQKGAENMEPRLVNDAENSSPMLGTTSSFSNSDATKATAIANTAQSKEKGQKVAGSAEGKTRREPTSWTQEEKEKFFEILRKNGKDWQLLHENLPSKSLTQIKTYFQNSKAKLGLPMEGIGGKIGTGRKRKGEESDSSSNIESTGQASLQRNSNGDDSNLKSANNNTAFGGLNVGISPGFGTNLSGGGADALAYSMLNRSVSQVLEDPTKLFQQMALAQQNPINSNMLPFFHPAMFASSNLGPVQSAAVQSTTIKPQHSSQQHSSQQYSSQQSLVPPAVVVQQQQAQSATGIIVSQQQQSIPLPSHHHHQDIQSQMMAQHLQKQAAQQQQQSSQALIQQQFAQVAALQQHLQPQSQSQPQQLAAQVPLHLQQLLHHLNYTHNGGGQEKQALNEQPALVNNHPQVLNQQKGMQPPQQLVHLPSQIFQLPPNQQVLLHQQQLYQQQQQLIRQQQQLQHQAHAQQLQKQQQQLQSGQHLLLEHPRQQINLLSGTSQSPSLPVSDIMKKADLEPHPSAKFSHLSEDDRQQRRAVSKSSVQSQSLSEAQSRAGDVKLFGQSLLSHPSSSAAHQLTSETPASFGMCSSAISKVLPGGSAKQAAKSSVSDSVLHPSASWCNLSGVNLVKIDSPACDASSRSSPVCEPAVRSVHEVTARVTERAMLSARNPNDSSAMEELPDLLQRLERTGFTSKRLDSGAVLNLCNSLELSCGLGQKASDTKLCSDNSDGHESVVGLERTPLNSKGTHQFGSFSMATTSGAQNSLPQTVSNPSMDALIAVPDWQLPQSNNSVGSIGDEILSQSMEALRRESAMVSDDVQGRNGTAGQAYIGSRESLHCTFFHSLPLFTNSQGQTSLNAGGALEPASLPVCHDPAHIYVSAASSFLPPISSLNLSVPDDQTKSAELGKPESNGSGGPG